MCDCYSIKSRRVLDSILKNLMGVLDGVLWRSLCFIMENFLAVVGFVFIAVLFATNVCLATAPYWLSQSILVFGTCWKYN